MIFSLCHFMVCWFNGDFLHSIFDILQMIFLTNNLFQIIIPDITPGNVCVM